MDGHNAAFNNDPFAYIKARTINNLAWFGAAVRDRTLGALNNQLIGAKAGLFDLEAMTLDTVKFKVVPATALRSDVHIGGYWCPFIQGRDLPGWVDFPKAAPAHRYVFTAAMNGCRLVVTNRSGTHFRVYHNQHPDEGGAVAARIWQLIAAEGHEIVGTFGTDEYGLAADDARSPNSFNFLYYRNGIWNFVSQPQTFDMATLRCTRIQHRAIMRSIQ